MSQTIQFRRGALSGLPSLAAGEPAVTTDQFRLYSGSAGGNRLLGLLHKNDATTAPTVNEDAGDGYSVGSVWTDTTNDKSYICSDSTVGAAVWQQFSGTGVGSSYTADESTLTLSGTTFSVKDDGVTDAKLRNSAALSVIGRSANSTGDPADIAAASDGQVLRRSGTALGFGTIATAGIGDDQVTYAKIQNVSATQRLLGRDTAGAGDAEEVTIATALSWLGTTVGMIPHYDTTGVWKAITPGTNGQVLTMVSGDSAWAAPITATQGSATLGGNYSFTSAAGTYTGSGLSVTLPAAGTYLVYCSATMQQSPSTGTAWFLQAKLRNTTDSADVANTARIVTYTGTTTGASFIQNYEMGRVVTVAASKVIELYVARDGTGTPTWSLTQVRSAGTPETATIGYIKLGN